MSIKILPKNLHQLAITLVLNFHKALKNYAYPPQHYFKLSVKLIKRVKSRVHYTRYRACIALTKLILINVKTTITHIARKCVSWQVSRRVTAKAVQNTIPPRRAA